MYFNEKIDFPNFMCFISVDDLKQMCRLCAHIKSPIEILGEIDDLMLGIKPKLVDCCRWHELEVFSNEYFPQNVCISCVQKLEQCWEFAESVSIAQQELLRIICNIKLDSLGENSSEAINTFESNEFECDISTDNDFCKEKIESTVESKKSTQPVKVVHKHNKHNFSLETNGERNENTEFQTNPSTLESTDNKRKRNPKRLTMTKQKRQMKKNSEDVPKSLHQKMREIVQEIEDQKNKSTRPKLEVAALRDKRRKSTKHNDDFLTFIRNEDRNSDGTIKPDRISELELDSWLMLQYQCYICGNCLGNYYTLRQHHLEEHPQDSFKLLCSFCKEPRTLTRKPALIDHTKTIHFPHLKYW